MVRNTNSSDAALMQINVGGNSWISGYVCYVNGPAASRAPLIHAQLASALERATRKTRRLLFQRFQVGDYVSDLPGIEPELGHRRMPGDDSLGERLLEILDRIMQMQRAKRRRDL